MDDNDRDERLDRLEREVAYYRREYNEIGARLLRLQEEQSRSLREARRSRTLTKLVRDAYRRGDRAATSGEVGMLMSQILMDSLLCDRVAILRRLPGGARFSILYSIGLGDDAAGRSIELEAPPDFLFTTSQSPPDPTADAFRAFVGAPYVLWCHGANHGYALLVANRSDSNVSRPYEPDDRELIEGALSVFVDMLGRKQWEIELRTAKLEAEEAGRSQTRFLAKLSHELRTPLNAILGFSEMLAMAKEFKVGVEECVNYANDIHGAGQYLLALINDILDFSAYGQETPAIVDETVDVLELLTKAYDNVRAIAEAKSVRVRVGLDGAVPEVRVDPIRMRQVLVNLLGNAVKFTPAGGEASASAHFDPNSGAVTLEVTDTGVGISDEHIPQVFEAFVQVHDTVEYANEGVGLGLTIAKTLVEAHGGTLSLTSAPGRGATARITLPPERTISASLRAAGLP